ncbi:hypothetical protein PQC18_gp66 [Streptomyces phage Pablito]|uniref:Uncharacterized protein n=1 Tax=Streptomyces phage Pablito TaxID=2894593 RepID=A0AAE9C6K2_9CAUD|nr:hypothetical protein PQC18_gp66 [Streptomyces phage Pablito]UFD98004.1 hypothetical protein [Streptomyces phage Pablito]
MKTLAKVLAFCLAFGTIGGLANAQAAPAPKPLPIHAPSFTTGPKLPTRPCPEDDAATRNCYWDAAKMGNGKGHSYIVDARGKVIYLNPALNNEAKRRAFTVSKQRAGWEYWGVVFGHQLCWAKVGDTSYIHCFDGFRETS